MSSFAYIARRRLRSGVSAGTPVTLSAAVQCAAPKPKTEANRYESRDLSAFETILHAYREKLSITVPCVREGDLPRWREFAASVADGQRISANLNDVAGVGRTEQALIDGDVKFSRQGHSATYTVSFSLEIL